MKKIELTVTQLIKYKQTIEISDEQFDLLNKQNYNELSNGEVSIISDILDFRDVYDYGDFDDFYWDTVE